MYSKLAVYSDIKGLRVLEIGAGTGSLTEIALEVLDDSTDYVFSDISPSFFAQAREQWGSRISCKVVDIGGNQSGFDDVPYDLIIGFDVVHATSNIELFLESYDDVLDQIAEIQKTRNEHLEVIAACSKYRKRATRGAC